ncbi:serine hydrolase domain-containing protein [Paenibacillus glycinis]|uniref:Serine hydrolase n=1 Tax=Paenibacillus glycinis TaxID=2697035 RepID=A0ABW9XT82_9BACL|nr:serine hydrolase domain-containing protein [Paenibacillus glycinis]NBD25527.1 serine hydrolase [Paenibacillus glycinis]
MKCANPWDEFQINIDDEVSRRIELETTISNTIMKNVEMGTIPGAVLVIASKGKLLLHKAYGFKEVSPIKKPMDIETIFDQASVTKIISTWCSILKLVEYGELDFEMRVEDCLIQARNTRVGKATVKDLLCHTSGLPERTYIKQYGTNEKRTLIDRICNDNIVEGIGEKVLYSNRGFILLGYIIEHISGMSLERFARQNIWEPTQMYSTMFNPSENFIQQIAPTEYREEIRDIQKGVVHDENAHWLGGVAGHAGVFSSSGDLTKFLVMLMAGGERQGTRILSEQLINDSLLNHTEHLNASRGLAWATDNTEFGRVFGHTGFTGTGLWINPSLDSFVILLTNRVHPTRNTLGIHELRENILKQSWKFILSLQQ